MKKAGLFIVVIGLAVTLFAGFSFVTREKVVEIGDFEMMADKNRTMDWSPYLGMGIMAIGVIVYLAGSKNKQL